MRAGQVNRISGRVMVVFSLLALLTVLSGYLPPPHPRDPDEGAAAHIFQLSIVALVPMLVVFLATADWSRPLQSVRPLEIPAVALMLAFGGLYYLEHYYYIRQ